jgi:hypothetical protein
MEIDMDSIWINLYQLRPIFYQEDLKEEVKENGLLNNRGVLSCCA